MNKGQITKVIVLSAGVALWVNVFLRICLTIHSHEQVVTKSFVAATSAAVPITVCSHEHEERPRYTTGPGEYACFRLRELNCKEGFQPECSKNIQKGVIPENCVYDALMWFDVNNDKQMWDDLHACGVVCKQDK